ncbi:hypothetical protein M2132_000818 [Dysgonomonas sp. PH5-45]|uniref:DUF6712 family protein n=1 Tax=unclassified Dysgonomonas TaxID=2630389 RepID=UPI00247564C2|nr:MULTISPECIES: hypothetical protein [unclassified Dysgonomonas]MDH6354490.1 hypothetical protein [Dysgonomonas sp. PH5-45]MDH6387453.1 hypothetical protein [Dysgonomonas sp. PH5-37]
MKQLTTIEQIKQNTRFVSKHVDDGRIGLCIDEAERLDVKPQLGDALYVQLKEWAGDNPPAGLPDFAQLMDGGQYEDCRGNLREFAGLRMALNYYVYARLVRQTSFSVTRFGFVEKQDQYSTQAELQERLAAEKDARTVADTYMGECLAYLQARKDHFAAFGGGKQKNRLRISIIGD